jgi:hypothetical protein
MNQSIYSSNMSTHVEKESGGGWTSWTSDGQVHHPKSLANKGSMDKLEKFRDEIEAPDFMGI